MAGQLFTRTTTAADAGEIARHRYPEASDGRLRDDYAAWVAGAMARGTYLGWLAEAGGKPVAGGGLTLLDWGPTVRNANPYRARIVNVYTDPAWRRKGLAQSLVARCLDAVRSRGITQVGLSASDEARAMYLSLGFRPANHELILDI
jgi:GNAT superfamily N-acetyltransferase